MPSTPIVTPANLNRDYFHCCANMALHPFHCSRCGHIMVACSACDTLFSNLNDTLRERAFNAVAPNMPALFCPHCRYAFEFNFMQNEAYQVSVKEWSQAGFQHLLLNHPATGEDRP